jgi:hypothetical protein
MSEYSEDLKSTRNYNEVVEEHRRACKFAAENYHSFGGNISSPPRRYERGNDRVAKRVVDRVVEVPAERSSVDFRTTFIAVMALIWITLRVIVCCMRFGGNLAHGDNRT